MPFPQFKEFHLPTLKLMVDGQAHSVRDLVPHISDEFALTDEEREERLQSGTRKVHSRTHWAMIDMEKAGLVERPKRGIYRITQSGQEVLRSKPKRIDHKLLLQFPSYQEWIEKSSPKGKKSNEKGSKKPKPVVVETETPEEQIGNAYQTLRNTLAVDLLDKIKQLTPIEFEQLVVDLMVNMGYGGTREDSSWVTKASGDEGIDGVINQDRLGLDVIYLQAKRFTDNKVGRPGVQKFVGALAGQQASKGVFMATSGFSRDAVEYAANVPQKVILIDGPRLADLMIEHDLGVYTKHTYEVKEIDSDYFED